jgi:nitrate reductase beta subunit
VQDIPAEELEEALAQGNLTPEEAEKIWRLTSMATFNERFVLPPLAREMAVEATVPPDTHRSETGFGFRKAGKRKW